MTLSESINEILSSFTSNDLFDSHTIINELITKPEYHLAYLREYPENCTVNLTDKLQKQLVIFQI